MTLALTNSFTTSASLLREVRLFRNGANQALRIPREFEFDTPSATIRKLDNGGLLIEPARPQYPKGSIDAVLAALAKMKPIADDDGIDPFANIDDGLLPLDDINL